MSVHSRSILIHLGYWYRFPFMNSKTPNFTSIWYGSVSSWKDKNDIWVKTRSNQSYFYPSLSKMRLMTSEIPWTDLKLKEKEEKQSFWSRYKFFEGIHKWRQSNFKLMRTNFLISNKPICWIFQPMIPSIFYPLLTQGRSKARWCLVRDSKLANSPIHKKLVFRFLFMGKSEWIPISFLPLREF